MLKNAVAYITKKAVNERLFLLVLVLILSSLYLFKYYVEYRVEDYITT